MQLSDPTGAGAEPDRPSRADQTADGDQLRSAAFDHAPTAMAILDSAGRVEHANQALLDLLGCGEGQLSGLSIRALTHPEDVVSSLEDLQRLLAEPSGAVEAVTRLVGFDRQPRWVRQTMSVLPGPGVPRRRVLLQAHQVDPERRIEGGGAGRPGDELTGLAQLRAAADARGGGCVVVLIDLDDFKRINASLGRAAGDRVLIEVSRRISRLCRPGDLAVRLGDDEFVVLLPEADERTARAVCDRIQRALDELIDAGGARVKIDASIGATVDPGNARPVATLLREADLALYAAKMAGKRHSRMFEAPMLELPRRRMRLENDLRHALAAHQLAVVYQPIVDLRTGRISGVEALSRWDHPVLGVVSPTEFIPLAEQAGLISELTSWVLGEATATMASWQREHPAAAELTLSVNVSCSNAEGAGFRDTVRQACDRAGVAPRRLIIEVTESGMIQSRAALADTMRELSGQGVRFAVDDFGAGYSSLSRLAGLPFSCLKLDRSFTAAIRGPRDPAPLVHAILAMAAGLGMSTVAEGVETRAQLECLQAAGCRYVQGYLTGRAAPAEQTLALVRAEPRPASPRAAARRPGRRLDALIRTVRGSGREHEGATPRPPQPSDPPMLGPAQG